ncbi:MAG: hypothetical protein ACUVWA_14800 [Candidatus Oleimicrobiaceae bacterium]
MRERVRPLSFNGSCKSRFIESKSHKKGELLKGLGGSRPGVSQMTGKYGIGYGAERATDILRERFSGMSPEWHKEHEAAFELAQNEAKQHFYRCPKCKKWVCENDWNEQEGLCVDDAPRVSVEVAAAKAGTLSNLETFSFLPIRLCPLRG